MIINIWSTPRTGSTWYTSYVSKEYKNSFILHQFLNLFNLSSYSVPNYNDYVYQYQRFASYRDFSYNALKRTINTNIVYKKRERNIQDEELYRITLLEKHNHERYPLILHNHVQPMTESAYNYLYKKANKNIFLYRKNHIDQLSSYALSYAIKNFHNRNKVVYENIEVEDTVLENLAERIVYWYKLPKDNGIIISYEELKFEESDKDMPKKQNLVATFEQLSEKTKSTILYLNDKILEQITQKSL